ncbi:MAG: DUF3108 domain-containing protein [Pseudomonadota bacterium]
MKKMILALTLLALSSHAVGVTLTGRAFEADYAVKRYGVTVATTTLRAEPVAARQVKFSSVTTPTSVMAWFGGATISEESSWERGQGFAIRPIAYRYARDDRPTRNVTIAFDAEARRATSTRGTDRKHFALGEGTLDKLTVLLTMMDRVRSGDKPFTLTVADHGREKVYEFVSEGIETIDTKLGSFATTKVTRRETGVTTRSITYWCAASLNNLPVLIRYQDGEDELVLKLVRFERRLG